MTEGFERRRVCTFRVNTILATVDEVETSLDTIGIPYEHDPYLPLAYHIDSSYEYILKGSRLFYDGKIYVQSLSSQTPAHAMDLTSGLHVLDVTAAPGSKTTHMATLMDNTGEIVACEKNTIRYHKLAHTVRLQQTTCVRLLHEDARNLPTLYTVESFDRILLDAPCSSEGRIRTDIPESWQHWSESEIQRYASVQRTLLQTIWPLLRTGGLLVYATCTMSPEENESVVSSLVTEHTDARIEPITLDIPHRRAGVLRFRGVEYHPSVTDTVRILPSVRSEGFFLARIRKV